MEALRAILFVAATAVAFSPSGASAQSRISQVQQRIVKIFGAGGIRNLNAYSSGVLVDDRGYVMTVWNHVLDTPELSVILHDGRRFDADVVAAEPKLDLAVLKLKSADAKFPSYDLKDAADVEPGTRVLAFSNMFKVATGDEPVSVVHGVVAAKTRLTTKRGVFDVPFENELYIIDAITNNAGAEGGLLTSLSGRPIALLGRQLRNGQTNTWVNYAVPLSELRPVVSQIIAGGYTAKSASRKDDAKPAIRPEDLGLVMVPDVVPRTPGYVDSVIPKSPAAGAGIAPEDLVVFINDQLVRSCSELKQALGGLNPGQKIQIVVRRDDVLKTFELVAPKKPGRGTER